MFGVPGSCALTTTAITGRLCKISLPLPPFLFFGGDKIHEKRLEMSARNRAQVVRQERLGTAITNHRWIYCARVRSVVARFGEANQRSSLCHPVSSRKKKRSAPLIVTQEGLPLSSPLRRDERDVRGVTRRCRLSRGGLYLRLEFPESATQLCVRASMFVRCQRRSSRHWGDGAASVAEGEGRVSTVVRATGRALGPKRGLKRRA